jgi:hypothetical protein
MSDKTYQQVLLMSPGTGRKTFQRCLLSGPEVEPGDMVELVGDPDYMWTVVDVGEPVREVFVHRTWNNNI